MGFTLLQNEKSHSFAHVVSCPTILAMYDYCHESKYWFRKRRNFKPEGYQSVPPLKRVVEGDKPRQRPPGAKAAKLPSHQDSRW